MFSPHARAFAAFRVSLVFLPFHRYVRLCINPRSRNKASRVPSARQASPNTPRNIRLAEDPRPEDPRRGRGGDEYNPSVPGVFTYPWRRRGRHCDTPGNARVFMPTPSCLPTPLHPTGTPSLPPPSPFNPPPSFTFLHPDVTPPNPPTPLPSIHLRHCLHAHMTLALPSSEITPAPLPPPPLPIPSTKTNLRPSSPSLLPQPFSLRLSSLSYYFLSYILPRDLGRLLPPISSTVMGSGYIFYLFLVSCLCPRI